jgi:hypothetical protein
MARIRMGVVVLIPLLLSGCATGLPVGGRLAFAVNERDGFPPGPRTSERPKGQLGPIEASKVDLDWFQGLLLRAGVPFEDLPEDGRRLRPQEAQALLEKVLSAQAALRDFGPWRMGAHLLWEVAQGHEAVSRRELHARMRRFQSLFVLRPDGCLVRATTGQAVQCVGEVTLLGGELRADGFTALSCLPASW